MPITLSHTAEELRLLRTPSITTRHRQEHDDKFKYDKSGIRPHHIDDIVKSIYEDLDILAGATSYPALDNLTDVTITGPVLNDQLTWNGSAWVNTQPPSSQPITQLDPVISALTTPPGLPVLGDRYLITAVATGVWTGKATQIAEWDGAVWQYTIPVSDNTVYVTNTLTTYRYTGSAWVAFAGTSILHNGNSIGNYLSIGTKDNYDVILGRNNTERLRLTSTGVKINNLYSLPTTDGINGQAIITNGSGTATWGNVDALPTQTGNNGKYLTTNGTIASWATISVSPTIDNVVSNGNYLSSSYILMVDNLPFMRQWNAAHTFTTELYANQATLDRTITFPDATGTLAYHTTGVPLISGQVAYATTGGALISSSAFLWNNAAGALTIGTGVSLGNDFNVAKNLAGGVYGSVSNEHANGIAGFVIGKDAGEYTAWQKYAPSRGGNFNGTSVPFADLTTLITSKSYSLNSVPLLVGASVHYQAIGITGTNLGTRLDGTGYRIGTLADIHNANTYLFQVGAGLYYNGTELTGPKFVTSGGTSGQFVKGDGTLDSSTYLTTAAAALAYQPLDATLTALAGLATGANKIPYSTGADTFSQLDLSTNTSLGTSDTTVSSQKAVKTYVDTVFTDTELALVSSFRFLTNN